LAVIKDGKVLLTKTYGAKEVGKPEKIDENTLFMIGSNTKAFTATSLCLLENEKKLTLDDKITRWIPYFKMNDSLAGNDARIRDMLCHRSGLETFQGDFTYWESNLSRKNVIERFGKCIPKYPFRTKFGYCNAAFVTAGEIIPATSGVSWENFIREKIFKPVGMNSAIALTSEIEPAQNKAFAHMIYDKKLTKIPFGIIDNLAAAGSIAASVKDMTKWILMQLDTGKVLGNQVIPKEVVMKTWEPQLIITTRKSGAFPSQFYNYGLGWFVRDYAGKRIITHDGGVNGFLSSTAFSPDGRIGFVILTNSSSANFQTSLHYQLLDALLGQPYKNLDNIFWKRNLEEVKAQDLALQETKKKIANNPKPALMLKEYAGIYTHHVYGDIEVKFANDMLSLASPIHGKLSQKIAPMGNNDFWCTYSNIMNDANTMSFEVQNGKTTTMTLKFPDFIEFDPYIFTRKK
jgi:CubicO group peptidase (beta-lactamase class C family)